jgi:hypothetical protein
MNGDLMRFAVLTTSYGVVLNIAVTGDRDEKLSTFNL